MQSQPVVNKKSPIKIILIIAAIIIILGSGALFYFNVGGISDYTLMNLSKIPLLKGFIQVKQPTNSEDKLKKLADELAVKEKQLQDKETSLNDRQKQLETLQAQLDKQQSDLNNLKLQLDSKKTDLKTLATYYENMDPQNAANILNQIKDDNVLVSILSNMNKDSASKILEQLNPQRAASITKILFTNASTIP